MPAYPYKLKNAVVPIKQIVIRCLCNYARYLTRLDQRDHILKKLIGRFFVHPICLLTYTMQNPGLKDSPNYHNRMLFLDVIDQILTICSKKFFRDTLFHDYLEVAHDPVANVRLRFVSMLRRVRRTLRLPTDTALLQKMTDATEPLLTRDLDRDVVQATGEVFADLGLFGLGPDDSGMSLPQVEAGFKVPKESTTSLESLTDVYLENSDIPEIDDKTDKSREEEEHSLLTGEWEKDGGVRQRFEDMRREQLRKGKLVPGKKNEPVKKGAALKKKSVVIPVTKEVSEIKIMSSPSTTISRGSVAKPIPNKPASGIYKAGSTELKDSPNSVRRKSTLSKTASNYKSDSSPRSSNSKLQSPRSSFDNTEAPLTSRLNLPRNVSAPVSRATHASSSTSEKGNISPIIQSIASMNVISGESQSRRLLQSDYFFAF